MQAELKLVAQTNNRFADIDPQSFTEEEQASLTELALKLLSEKVATGPLVNSPDAVKEMLRLQIGEEKREVFGVLFCTNKHRVISNEILFMGTVSSAHVCPRVVVQRALELNAVAALLFHNHPSGDCSPSSSDISITQKLRAALSLMEIRVLDHLIVSAENALSMAEEGYM